MRTTTIAARRPRRFATIIATALFGVALAASAAFSTVNASHDLASGGKSLPKKINTAAGADHGIDLLAGGSKPLRATQYTR
jgi:hypothetical protein